MPQSPEFLTSATAAAGRLIRQAEYARIGETVPTHVVWCEVDERQHVELDADNAEHGERLAKTWLEHGMAICCSVHRVRDDGSLVNHLICDHEYFWPSEGEFEEAA